MKSAELCLYPGLPGLISCRQGVAFTLSRKALDAPLHLEHRGFHALHALAICHALQYNTLQLSHNLTHRTVQSLNSALELLGGLTHPREELFSGVVKLVPECSQFGTQYLTNLADSSIQLDAFAQLHLDCAEVRTQLWKACFEHMPFHQPET